MRLGVWCLGRSKRGVGQSTDEQNMRRRRRDRTARVAVRRFFSGAKRAGGCPPSLRDHNPAGRACVRSIGSVRCATTILHAVCKSIRQRNGKVGDSARGRGDRAGDGASAARAERLARWARAGPDRLRRPRVRPARLRAIRRAPQQSIVGCCDPPRPDAPREPRRPSVQVRRKTRGAASRGLEPAPSDTGMTQHDELRSIAWGSAQHGPRQFRGAAR